METWSALAYLVAAICFIMALRGLSSPVTARNGLRFGVAGMAIAVATTLALPGVQSFGPILGAIALGGIIGAGGNVGGVAAGLLLRATGKPQFCFLVLGNSDKVARALGATGIRILVRVMGLLLVALAVQYFVNGLVDLDVIAKPLG